MAITTKVKDPVAERTTPQYEAILLKPDGNVIPGSSAVSVTLTLYDAGTKAIVNGVDGTNILNTDRGTLDENGKLVVLLEPADTAILDDTKGSEKRVMLLEWAAGEVEGKHEVVFKVKNLVRVP